MMQYKGLKINSAIKGVGLPGAEDIDIEKQLTETFDKMDMFFGNLDYSNLNYETARMLDLKELEEYGGRGKAEAGESGEDELIVFSHVQPIHTTGNYWTGACIEAGCGNERRLYGYLKAKQGRPARDETLTFPHPFSSTPQVFYGTVSGALIGNIRKYYEEVLGILDSGVPDGNYYSMDATSTGLTIGSSGYWDNDTEKMVEFFVIGEGTFEIPVTYEREDLNIYDPRG